MKTYTGDAKVKGVVVGKWSLSGPADATEFTKWASGLTGDSAQRGFAAWLYGAKLHARAAAVDTADIVADHILSTSGKQTDLDKLVPVKAIGVVNALRAAVAGGYQPGDKNMKKAEHFAAALVSRGEAKEVNGTLTPVAARK